MSATLVATDLSAGHGARQLFSGLDLVVAPGDVVGLVGPNGAGKSTLLRLLAGLSLPEAGAVRLTPGQAQVGYLPQEAERRPDETVSAFLARRTGVAGAQQRLDVATSALARGTAGAEDEYAEALEAWLALGGADLDERSEQVRADVRLGVPTDALMTSLSGGQAARTGLASLLLSRYDLFLLDEPTNDLDLEGLDRLEQFVAGLRAGVVVVSHDREFLARTVTQVVELDLAQQKVSVYGGSYSDYLRERELARQHAREAFEDYEERKSSLQARARMQRGWSDKGTREALRKATDNDKHLLHRARQRSEKQAAKAKQTDRLIERLDVVEEPRKEWRLQLEIAAAPRAGAVVATLRDVVVRRGRFTLGPMTLQVDWGDRLVVTGANGSGKSTLLAVLLGRLAPDGGQASLGPSVRIGEIDQARAAFDSASPLLESFARHVPGWPDSDVRTLLAKFGLSAEHVLRPASSLSPGERTRAGLALLQAVGVNLLVLDEPTNHLDLPAIEQLEQALESFNGTLVLVTHDRRMLESVRHTRRLVVDDGRVTEL
ncbi:MAG TPA: ABC-F family ATP-binding cassette domain-containing protein [Actinomycetales bacterium]|nr:ABC-F family ATP-binding cassette domain-containing protein [Actinomycetales bacterium]